MKKSFIKIGLLATFGAMCVLGATTLATITTQAETTQKVQKSDNKERDVVEIMAKLNDLKAQLESKEDFTVEEYKEIVAQIDKATMDLAKSNSPEIGDGVNEVCLYLELLQANAEVESLGRYLDTIDVSQYQPMSAEELEALIGE